MSDTDATRRAGTRNAGSPGGSGKADERSDVPPMRFLDYAAMRKMPEPRWIVEGVLQERTAALMFGKSNTFKSFLAIDLALCIATGKSWHGVSVRQGRVLYIATEGANGVGRIRIPGWYDAREVSEVDRGNAFLWPREVLLDSENSVDALIRSLNAEIHGQGFTLVVADIFGGTMLGPETKDETARAWVAGVQGLIRETGVTVMTVAHTGWADETRARMHTHFWGSFDTRLKVEGNKNEMETVLSVDRHKDADSHGRWGFRMVPMTGADGVPTLVPERADDVKIVRRNRVSGKPQIALEALDDALAEYGINRTMDGLPSCKVVAMNDWRKMCDRHRLSESDKEDARRQAFNRARAALQDKDEIDCCGEFVWRTAREQRDEL